MIWPFRRRRRANTVAHPENAAENLPPAYDKQKPAPPASAATSPKPIAHTPPVPRRSSRRNSTRRPTASHQDQALPAQQWQPQEKLQEPANKDNAPPPNSSRENITALPISRRLDSSPHLRPVDSERPHIPYNFRPYSMSQTSVQKQDAISRPARPNTLHSKRSQTDYAIPARRTSSRLSRRRDDALREEEIRAMSAPIPIPKRPGGDSIFRRESKKVRSLIGKDSQISIPPEGSIHSSMSGPLEQRGWEIGGLALFNPRPSVRLSATPQYVVSTSLPQSPSGVLYRIDSIRGKNKDTPPRDTARKRRTVGDEAEELDASDIRLIMERDTKRREKRQQERQEKLDRKLKSREGRNRGDSDAKQRQAEDEKRVEESRSRAQQEIQAQGTRVPPTAVHPALRNLPASDSEPVGLGIGKPPPPVEPPDAQQQAPQPQPIETIEEREMEDAPQNPFSDSAQLVPPSPFSDQLPGASATSLPLDSPAEEPYLGTAQAVRLSMTNTPPLSPTYGGSSRLTPSTTQIAVSARQQSISAQSVSAQSASDLAPPPRIPVERRSSDPPQERKTASWATFFRRGGTNLRKTRNDGHASPSSFSNTSRESMRNQPLPAHLVDSQRPPTVRSRSGTPVRTQSKFREDLPEMPISPPESRTQSPAASSAGALLAAQRAGKSTPQPVDIPGRVRDADRNDTPVSQSMKGHTAMAGSMASIDSEGSWLASGSLKRASNQSALSKSLSKRNEFNASYEELGVDTDAEYLSRNRARKISNPTLMGASPDEESEEDEQAQAESSGPPLTVHGSARRRPTLVQHDPRLKSREGLVTEFAAEQVETPAPESMHESPSDDEEESEDDFGGPESPPQIERAQSVNYGSRHSRQFSAGSAKLLDVPSKRESRTGTPDLKQSPVIPDPSE